MAVLTPTAKQVVSMGNKIGVIGTFSAASDTDTWAPGLMTVDGAWITNGANDVDYGLTFTGSGLSSTVVVQTAGALANVKILAVGT